MQVLTPTVGATDDFMTSWLNGEGLPSFDTDIISNVAVTADLLFSAPDDFAHHNQHAMSVTTSSPLGDDSGIDSSGTSSYGSPGSDNSVACDEQTHFHLSPGAASSTSAFGLLDQYPEDSVVPLGFAVSSPEDASWPSHEPNNTVDVGMIWDDPTGYHSDSSSSSFSSPSHSPDSSLSSKTDRLSSRSNKDALVQPASKRAKTSSAPTVVSTTLGKNLHLELPEDELINLDMTSIQKMAGMRLTKSEERELKKLRRKVKNKVSAAQSRQKKRDYMEGLEARVNMVTEQNLTLRTQLDTVMKENQRLHKEITALRDHFAKFAQHAPPFPGTSTAVSNNNTAEINCNGKRTRMSTAQTVSCFMVVMLLFSALFNPRWTFNPLNINTGTTSSASAPSNSDSSVHLDPSAAGILNGAAIASTSAPSFTGRKLLAEWTEYSTDEELETPSPAIKRGRRMLEDVQENHPAVWDWLTGFLAEGKHIPTNDLMAIMSSSSSAEDKVHIKEESIDTESTQFQVNTNNLSTSAQVHLNTVKTEPGTIA